MAYLVLFLSAFGAATLLPIPSEVTLSVMLEQGHPWFVLWLVASIGNTAGAAVNWWVGSYLMHWQHSAWFPVKQEALTRAKVWFQRYGIWTLLFAWLPVIGDAFTFVAGIMRVRFSLFWVLVFTGKALRYAVFILLYASAT